MGTGKCPVALAVPSTTPGIHRCLIMSHALARLHGATRYSGEKSPPTLRFIHITAMYINSRARQSAGRQRAGASWEGERWGHLVCTDEMAGPLSTYNIRSRFNAFLRLAGLPLMRYHDLRHGAASLMAAQGVPPRAAMDVLGHEQISTTMDIYTHVAQEMHLEVSSKSV